MKVLTYIVQTRDVNGEWEEYSFRISNSVSEKHVMEVVVNVFDIRLTGSKLIAIILHKKKGNFIPIVAGYRRKQSIVIEAMQLVGYKGISKLILDEILRKHISIRVPFLHNTNFVREVLTSGIVDKEVKKL